MTDPTLQPRHLPWEGLRGFAAFAGLAVLLLLRL